MAKRRRERDRPKAAPEAPYNPNKRILLSYESGEDGEIEDGAEEQIVGTGFPNAVDIATADYEIAEYPDEDEGESEEVSVRGSGAVIQDEHLVHGSEGNADESDGDSRDAVQDKASLWSRTASKNTVTGQWAALGSLSYQWENDAEDGEVDEEHDSTEEEAMAYLRAVRFERQGMPTVLQAQKTYSRQEIYESGVGDTRGYFGDGAYVARPCLGPDLPRVARVVSNPQEAFTERLKARFLQLRDQLHLPTTPEAQGALDDTHPTSFRAGSNRKYAEWHRALRATTPLPVQLCCLKQDDAVRLVDFIRMHYLVRESEFPARISTWIWSALARLDDVSLMQNDHVSAVRELAKKAILVQHSFQSPDEAKQLELAAEEGRGSSLTRETVRQTCGDEIDLEGESAGPDEFKPATSITDENTTDRRNTLATLDMIILLVGEIFRQRDLLEFRLPWRSDVEKNMKA